MKMTKKFIAGCTAAFMLSVTSVTAFAAASYSTPAEAAAGITGKSYGAIANEAGKLEEFKAEMLEMKKARISALTADGKITQEQANTILQMLESRQAVCNGTGNNQGGCGAACGMGFGRGQNGRGRRQNSADCMYQ